MNKNLAVAGLKIWPIKEFEHLFDGFRHVRVPPLPQILASFKVLKKINMLKYFKNQRYSNSNSKQIQKIKANGKKVQKMQESLIKRGIQQATKNNTIQKKPKS